MKILRYLGALLTAVIGVAALIELLTGQLLPDSYRGYLIDKGNGTVTWSRGPFSPAEPSSGFNDPVPAKKPANTLRILTLGDSITEGWLTAQVVFERYGQQWDPGMISSFSRALEFNINEIADAGSDAVEVINLGVAAYNVTDIMRMTKQAMVLQPDLLIIQIGGNETWTTPRSNYASYLSDDIPYFEAEAAYEVLAGIQAKWSTLSGLENAFNPLALFGARVLPIKPEPPGRDEGLQTRLDHYNDNLEALGNFLKANNVPVLFIITPTNLAGFRPFGSMAKAGSSEAQIETLNTMLLDALADSGESAKQKYIEILALDDGIAEANWQLGQIYLDEGNIDKAREHLWKANDRDFVLKRAPFMFHEATREYARDNNFALLDFWSLVEQNSPRGLIDYAVYDDEVHPNRSQQFAIGAELARVIATDQLLPTESFSGDPTTMPAFADYDEWTGFDANADGTIALLRAVHNYLSFGRYRTRLAWDPRPERFLLPVQDDLNIAMEKTDIEYAGYFSLIIDMLLGKEAAADAIISSFNCSESPERGKRVANGVMQVYKGAVGYGREDLRKAISAKLAEEGCAA